MWLTHAGGVDEDLLGRSRGGIEVQGTVLEVEGGVFLVGAVAAGVLGREASEDAALGSVEGLEVDGTARVDGNDAKVLVAGGGAGGGVGSGSGRSGKDEVLELHFEWFGEYSRAGRAWNDWKCLERV